MSKRIVVDVSDYTYERLLELGKEKGLTYAESIAAWILIVFFERLDKEKKSVS